MQMPVTDVTAQLKTKQQIFQSIFKFYNQTAGIARSHHHAVLFLFALCILSATRIYEEPTTSVPIGTFLYRA